MSPGCLVAEYDWSITDALHSHAVLHHLHPLRAVRMPVNSWRILALSKQSFCHLLHSTAGCSPFLTHSRNDIDSQHFSSVFLGGKQGPVEGKEILLSHKLFLKSVCSFLHPDTSVPCNILMATWLQPLYRTDGAFMNVSSSALGAGCSNVSSFSKCWHAVRMSSILLQSICGYQFPQHAGPGLVCVKEPCRGDVLAGEYWNMAARRHKAFSRGLAT